MSRETAQQFQSPSAQAKNTLREACKSAARTNTGHLGLPANEYQW